MLDISLLLMCQNLLIPMIIAVLKLLEFIVSVNNIISINPKSCEEIQFSFHLLLAYIAWNVWMKKVVIMIFPLLDRLEAH